MIRRAAWIVLAASLAAGLALAALLGRVEPPRAAAKAQALPRALPQRVICMAPSIAETVFALGAGDRVAGVSEYTVYPPEAKARPSVGAVFNPDLERIAALKPDLVIIQERLEKVEALCRLRGIEVMRVNMISVASILQGVRDIGDRMGRRLEAEALAASIQAELHAVEQATRDRPRVKVYLGLDRTPGTLKGLFTSGKRAFMTEMIRIAGGQNIFGDLPDRFPPVSAESVLARAPDVVIETYPSQDMAPQRKAALAADWDAMPGLPAVRDRRVYIVTDDYIVVPGPRVGRIAIRLAQLIHPETEYAR